MPTTIEKVLLLQDLEIFGFASTEHLAKLALVCHQIEFDVDNIIFRKGEPSSKLYLLVEGHVSLENREGQKAVVEKCALGFWSFFAESTHRVTASAQGKCTLLAVSLEDMVDLLTAEPEFCLAIVKYLARLGRTLRQPDSD
jgi:CRP-like cAMP-binding protein